MCSAPVSTSTELLPITGAIGEEPAADGATPGGAVNTAFTASGSLNIASFSPLGANVSVNASPSRAAQRSITHVGASAHASVSAIAGTLGPGGSRNSSIAADGVSARSIGVAGRAVAIATS